MSISNKILLFIVTLVAAGTAFADAPYITNNIAENRGRIQNGDISCEVSRPQATINVGAYGNNGSEYRYANDDKGGYVSISIPLGGDDKMAESCERLADLSRRQKELQIKRLEMEMDRMEKNQQMDSQRAMQVDP
ncbi:hypothetical protein MOC16_gp271 [Klebsiella phage vB_KpM_FBKp24]|uniref:Uncharacterized protein n=1 Tax=Klebsiella phage vB_KpM_FBKp24 TaxID=2801834 RepID=A0A7U0J5J3_9CAUD|nr:hypothetical protein MOC16_gp271 [Klebsiella phage vB_KpM_FBKp24]QQV92234.1 hypothetical protein vBKpMFBKp24_142 [Klebsiella phage vB_KpM_FBKp24]